MADNNYHIHISSSHSWMKLNLKEVWQYRDLIYLFTKRNFVVSYKQTILGPAWIFLTPLFSSIVQAFVFGGIAGIKTDGVPMMLFYLCSNAIWAFFSSCLTNNANTFTANAYVFGKVYFPRLTTPISNVLSSMIRFGIQMILVMGFMAYFLAQGAVAPNWAAWVMIPVELIHLGILGMGFGIIISSMTTKYRTLNQEIYHKGHNQNHLNAKADHGRKHIGDRGGQTGEINLTEHIGIGGKGIGIVGQTAGEKRPDGVAAQVEQHHGNAVGFDAGNAAKHKGLNNGAE